MNNYTISSSKGAGELTTFEPEVQPIELFLDGKWVDSVGDKSTKLYLVALKRKSKTSITADSFEVDLEKGRIQFKSKESNCEEKVDSDPFPFFKSNYIVPDVKVKLSEKVEKKFDLYKEKGFTIEETTNVETEQEIPMEPSKKDLYAEVGFSEEMIKQIDDYLDKVAKTRMQGVTLEPTLIDPFPTKIDLADTIALNQAAFRRMKKLENPTETETD